MFATHDALGYPFQFGPDRMLWRGVELMLHTPWLLVTFEINSELNRTFLLKGTDELLRFAEGSGPGTLSSVRLVLPPDGSPGSDWIFVPVRRVEKERRSIDGAVVSAVVTTSDGRRYGSFPIQPLDRANSDLELLVDLGTTAG